MQMIYLHGISHISGDSTVCACWVFHQAPVISWNVIHASLWEKKNATLQFAVCNFVDEHIGPGSSKKLRSLTHTSSLKNRWLKAQRHLKVRFLNMCI